MHRRHFLRAIVGAALAMGAAPALAFFGSPRLTAEQKKTLEGLLIIDAHAHPDRLHLTKHEPDPSSTVASMREMGMCASVFAAVGDRVYLSNGRLSGTEYDITRIQLDFWTDGTVASGDGRLILKPSDIPLAAAPGSVPRCILAIEGGDPLAGKPERVNEFHTRGVRLITLIHYNNNHLGDCMKSWTGLNPGPRNNGLTAAGRRVIERMQDLGMVVDVAHADSLTLRQICEITRRPLLDSHTHPCSVADTKQCGRFRTWQDMEAVAKTGGVVCTWPWATSRGKTKRETFRDWAREIKEMKMRIGMEHVGLGTDGGGGLPRFVDGYRDVRDLVHLVGAMREEGFTRGEISDYLGGNFYRVLRKNIG